MPSRKGTFLAIVVLALGPSSAAAAPALLSRWSFDGGAGNAVAGGPAGDVQNATPAEGHQGQALEFADWAARDLVTPDRRAATRVVVPDDPRLNPPYPFRVDVWIRPTADPLFFGGIVEKGRGRGGAYRLVLLRGLKVEASLGDQHLTVRSDSPISLNVWHEVALVADGKTLTLLIDGARAGQLALASPPVLGSGEPLVIGERFTGRIDEVAITSE